MSDEQITDNAEIKSAAGRHQAAGERMIAGKQTSRDTGRRPVPADDLQPQAGASGRKNSGNFTIRLFAVLIVIIALGAYQFTATVKAKDTEIAQLQQELTEAEGERDKLEEGVRSMSDKIRTSGLTDVSADSEDGDAAAAQTQAAETEDNSLYNDGDFEGEAQGYGGAIRVKVTISGGKITNIDISEHASEDDAYFQFAKNVADDIMDAQSTEVDTIAGATMTSKGIRDAVVAALKNAEK